MLYYPLKRLSQLQQTTIWNIYIYLSENMTFMWIADDSYEMSGLIAVLSLRFVALELPK